MIFADPCEKDALAAGHCARSALRRRIDQQRVQLWFRWIRDSARGATYYALEKQLIPEGFRRNAEGALSHRNRMARYDDGKHVPRAELVRRAELAFPGSRPLLEHVYWQIIDPDFDLVTHRTRWITGLGAAPFQVLFHTNRCTSGFLTQRCKVNRRLLLKLENQGTFDALAATALLLREANEGSDDKSAFECARSFWVLLLLIGSSKPFVHFLPAMARLAGSALTDAVCYQGERVDIASAPIRTFEKILRFYCLSEVNAGKLQPTYASLIRRKLLLIRSFKYFTTLVALRLPTTSADTLCGDSQGLETFHLGKTMREMALQYLVNPAYANRSFYNDVRAYWHSREHRWPTGKADASASEYCARASDPAETRSGSDGSGN